MHRKQIKKYLRPLIPIPTSQQMRGALRQPVACLLFDIYGTLFISAAGDIGTMGQPDARDKRIGDLLKAYGISSKPADLMQQVQYRIKQEHEVLKNKGILFPEVRIEEIWRAVLPLLAHDQIREFSIQFELIVNPVWPMPHLKSLLTACQCAGLKMGLISNAQFFTPYLFNWFLSAEPAYLGFDPQLTLYSYRFGEAKPSPRLFMTAARVLRSMKIEPPQVVYIGNDMRNDIMPARKTGFQTVLFAGDARSLRLRENDPICEGIEPDLVVTDLEQLLLYFFDKTPSQVAEGADDGL